VFSNSIQPMWG